MTSAGPHFGDELQEYLDKRLDASVRRVVEAHVDGCEDCRRKLEAIAWVKQVMRRVPFSRAPGQLQGKVTDAVETERVDTERLSR